MIYAALDLGSSFTKGAILDSKSMTVSLERSSPTPPRAAGDWWKYEIDAEDYYKNVWETLAALLDEAPEAEGVIFSTQMHGCVITNGAFRPLTNYISWRDRLSLKQNGAALETLRARITDDMMRPVGAHLKHNQAVSALFARGFTGGGYFNTLGGYIIGRLAGRHVCHITNAAPSGMADIFNCEWRREIIEAAGLMRLRMPEIIPDVRECGCFSYKGRRIAVYPDVGDHQACVMGSQARPETDLCANIGTAGLLSLSTQSREPGSFELRPYFGGMYLRSVSGLPGGKNLDALARFFADFLSRAGVAGGDVWRVMTDCAEAAGGHSPLDEGFTLDGFIWDAYRAMGREYFRAAGAISPDAQRLAFAGGCATKNPALRRAIARETGLTPIEPDSETGVMRGLLRLLSTFSRPGIS